MIIKDNIYKTGTVPLEYYLGKPIIDKNSSEVRHPTSLLEIPNSICEKRIELKKIDNKYILHHPYISIKDFTEEVLKNYKLKRKGE